jgi:hypothetical protein
MRCTGCHEECDAITADFGRGAYEFWGAPGVDVDIQTVSNCCEAEIEWRK